MNPQETPMDRLNNAMQGLQWLAIAAGVLLLMAAWKGSRA